MQAPVDVSTCLRVVVYLRQLSLILFCLQNIALNSVFHLTDGAAWIFHDSSLLFYPGTSHLMVEESLKKAQRTTLPWPGLEPMTSVS